MNYRWFLSKTVRHATAMRKHYHRMLCAQRDILSGDAVKAVTMAVENLTAALKAAATKADLEERMTELDAAAAKWLKPYPNANYRENVEVFLVALAVAMGIRTFFAQPFKIPTGSMQPTLYGVTSVPDFTRINFSHENRANVQAEINEQFRLKQELQIPGLLTRVQEWFQGVTYIDITAKADGVLERVDAPVGIRIINFWQTLYIGGVAHTILFPPDYGQPDLKARAGLQIGQPFRKGDPVVRLKVLAGDHLFVDRITFNFRQPTRGEIVVFATIGIDADRRASLGMPSDQFYIKRMVSYGPERVQVGADHHLIIDGRRLDRTTPHFDNVYADTQVSTDPANPYLGHEPRNLFANDSEFQVRSNHFLVMGDNTRNSLDSRYFGEVDADYIIGKSCFVYWPLTKRFGWGNH